MSHKGRLENLTLTLKYTTKEEFRIIFYQSTYQYERKVFVTCCTSRKLCFTKPSSWFERVKCFERYLSVSGYSRRPDTEKLMYSILYNGWRKWGRFNTVLKVPETYSEMLLSFENHFAPRKNVIFEIFQFNAHVQHTGKKMMVLSLLYLI